MMPDKDPEVVNISCVNFNDFPAMLISTQGTYCNVWRRTSHINGGYSSIIRDVVIKQHIGECRRREIETLNRHYHTLRQSLGSIVPATIFIQTMIDGSSSVLAISEAVNVWFNVANPLNQEELYHLMQQHPQIRDQLEVFTEFATDSREFDGRIIDLFGMDNLVLDHNFNVRYLDSFFVFFYEDMLDMIDKDDILNDQIVLSLKRLEYIEHLLSL